MATTLRWMWGADDDTGLHDLFAGTPATWIFLGVVSAISLADVALGPSGSGADKLTHHLGFSPALVASGDLWRLLTQTLVNPPTHNSGAIGHLVFNAVGLVFAGPRVERAFGALRFVVLVVVAQLCASVAVFVSVPIYLIAGGGTSGALFGLMAAALVIAVNRRRRSQLDAIYLGVALALISVTWLMGLVDAPAETNISHLGGFLAGLAIATAWCMRSAVHTGSAIAVALIVVAGSLAVVRTADARRSDLTVLDEIPVGFVPEMVTPGFGSIWVTGEGIGAVARIDERTGRVSARISEEGAGGLPVVADGRFWVPVERGIAAIDPLRNRVESYIRLPGDDDVWGLGATKDALWAAVPEPGVVVRIDLASDEQRRIKVGAGTYVVATDGRDVWASSYGAETVSRLDPRTGTVLETIKLATSPYMMTVLDGSLWVGAQPYIYRLDPRSLDIIAKIDVGGETWTLTPDDDGMLVVASRSLRQLVRIDPATNAVDGRYELGLRRPTAAALTDETWTTDPSNGSVVRMSSIR